jgi:hypothetical protein
MVSSARITPGAISLIQLSFDALEQVSILSP